MKTAIVIYDTKYGNTEKRARALARGMEKQGVRVDTRRVDEVDVNRQVEYDLLAIGGPTHRRNVSASMEAFLEKLKSVNSGGKKAFAFDTRRTHWLAGSAGKRIERRLKRLRMDIAKPYSSAIILEEGEGRRLESESRDEWKERWHRSVRLQEDMEEMFEKIGADIAGFIQ